LLAVSEPKYFRLFSGVDANSIKHIGILNMQDDRNHQSFHFHHISKETSPQRYRTLDTERT